MRWKNSKALRELNGIMHDHGFLKAYTYVLAEIVSYHNWRFGYVVPKYAGQCCAHCGF